jgi:GcrA cell cycle regulator
MMELMNWAPEHSDALREQLAWGVSFAEAARRVNGKFGTTYTRNAALGRAKRMGLVGLGKPPAPPSIMPPRLERPYDSRPPRGKSIGYLGAMPKPGKAEPTKLRCVAIEPRHLSLIELERGDCRYPYGGDEEGEAITFCGHPRRAGSSYCTSHFHLSREPIVPPERTVSAAVLRVVEAA